MAVIRCKSKKHLKGSVSLVISSVLVDSTRHGTFKKMNVLHSKFDIFDRFGVMDLRRFITLKTVVEEGSFCEFRKIVLHTIDGDFSYSAA